MSDAEYEAYSGIRTEHLVRRLTPGLTTDTIIDRFFRVGGIIAGHTPYEYQRPFIQRLFRCILEREADEITALWSRQSGKSDSLSFAAAVLLIMLPLMSKEFPDDDRFNYFDVKSQTYRSYLTGFWIGVFAPKKEQAGVIFNRIRTFLRRDATIALLREVGVTYDVNNGDTFRLSSGSFAKCSTASDQANIEGATLHLAILEESQDISDEKANKSIGPMLAACVIGSTEIVTCGGERLSIEAAVASRSKLLVPCVSHDTSQMASARVQDWVDSGAQPCLEVTLQSGRTITGTLPHPLLCHRRAPTSNLSWVMLKDMRIGMHVCLPEVLPHGSVSMQPDRAYRLGSMAWNSRDDSKKSLHNLRCYDAAATAQIIAGLFDSAGYVLPSPTGVSLRFSRAGKAECLTLLEMLHRFGIHGALAKNQPASHDCWVLDIPEGRYVERFTKHIHLRSQLKAGAIARAINPAEVCSAKVCDEYPGIVCDTIISIRKAGLQRVFDLVVPTHHSFVANGIISHNTGGTMVKIGTANAIKSHFYNAIRRNERRENQGDVCNNFKVPWEVAAKYNTFYDKYVRKEMTRLGETSDEFLMNFCCRFMLERGLAIPEHTFANRTVTEGPFSDLLPAPRRGMFYVAGIDFGKIHDSTVVTILEVNWDNPRSVVNGYDNDSGNYTVELYGKHIVDWLEMQGDDYEAQYVKIRSFLSKWPIARMGLDYTGVGVSLGDRFKAMFDGIDVEFVTYSDDSKDQLCREFLADLHTGMITWPGGAECRDRREFKQFKTQMLDLEKTYRNGLLSLHHPEMRGCHDDYAHSCFIAVHTANSKPFGGEVEETQGIYGRR